MSLGWAIWRNDLEGIRKSIEKDSKVLNTVSEIAGNTLLHDAIVIGRSEENTAVVKFLLDKGADPSAKNKDGETPLMVLVSLTNELNPQLRKAHAEQIAEAEKVAKLLIARGANPNIPNKDKHGIIEKAQKEVNREGAKAVPKLGLPPGPPTRTIQQFLIGKGKRQRKTRVRNTKRRKTLRVRSQ